MTDLSRHGIIDRADMTAATPTLVARTVDHIGSLDAGQWDRCAGAGNPFVSHAFLYALEDSESVGAEAGWLPHHLVIEDGDGVLQAAVPLYLKGHSQGEYVFDHGWAHAYEQAGGAYYPKLQASVPFSPITGPRLLVPPGPDQAAMAQTLISTLETVTKKLGVSSLHATFVTQEQSKMFGAAGWILRHGQQFHWHNEGYGSFDDFLASLTSRKRKNIRKERQAVADAGLSVRAVAGSDIAAADWDAFYRFYIDTYDRKWGYPYLTRGFFDILQATMAEQVVLMMAADGDGRPVAGALNLRGSDALYGRNWGCLQDYRFLHFETCYYQAIDYAIAHGLDRVEAGTQGPHKIQRGYLPVRTYSAHFIPNPSFRDAVARFCREESAMVGHEIAALATHSPYRCGD